MKKWRVWPSLILAMLASTAFASPPPHELASLHAQLAFEYSRSDQLVQALDAADRAIGFDDASAAAWLARAHVLARMARDADADSAYRQALVLAPGRGDASNNYGLFLCERGQFASGRAQLETALADPGYASPHLVYLNLGQCNMAAGRSEVAGEHFFAALRAKPAFVPAVRALTVLYLKQGQVKLAAHYHDRLLELAGDAGPEDLWMGVEIARLAGDRVRENEYATKLQKRFPDSRETQQMLSGT